MKNIIMLIICVVPLLIYIIQMKKFKINTKLMIIMAMFSAMSYILSMIPFIKYPQGGGITLLSMLPILMVSTLYGRLAGVTTGLLSGLISLIGGSTLLFPAQILLDYIIPPMALGLGDICGTDKKYKVFMGSLLAVILSVLCQVASGYLFFGQYAPKEMNPLVYSLVYNFSGSGVEGLLSAIVLISLPVNSFKKLAKA
ncbi:energy-coupled thiamine transporter ThiT [Romboutsia maritimum]|uniref:Energy-coupled thiamine transporter ThiT n=1 Tax=Romboutsia maritimum TaxID=2020948 RepID=A0A371IQP0_9FIRM|nr:energy-coupled thiamine transporter ThiT [Romboutsia maritimum]RDY22786.1 energy-coupled thiamine transporter ThiT [Romboutsia maritimum]